jgi:hypothetical protein
MIRMERFRRQQHTSRQPIRLLVDRQLGLRGELASQRDLTLPLGLLSCDAFFLGCGKWAVGARIADERVVNDLDGRRLCAAGPRIRHRGP